MRISVPWLLLCLAPACQGPSARLRPVADPVGFAHEACQLHSLLARIEARQGERLATLRREAAIGDHTAWRVAISPHDDHAYVGCLYPALLDQVRARTVVLFGVAHKARPLGVEDRLVFDSFSAWRGPYGPVRVSPWREGLMARLPAGSWIVQDELQAGEHSLEALIPFLQHRRRDLEIVPILVPAMSRERMAELARPLSRALAELMRQEGLGWGRDVALLVSNDAVHYGDEGWGGRSYAEFGVGEAGYRLALAKEREIVGECLVGPITPEKASEFCRRTVREEDHREYRWTWCGRYAVPFGLLAAWFLAEALGEAAPVGRLVGYATSIDHEPLAVADLGMGLTAPATLRHWVGYAAIGYE